VYKQIIQERRCDNLERFSDVLFIGWKVRVLFKKCWRILKWTSMFLNWVHCRISLVTSVPVAVWVLKSLHLFP